MAPAPEALRAAVERAIDGVTDPCSRFNGTNVSFIELGMVDVIELEADGRVLVKLLLDDPTCVYLTVIRREIREAVLALDEVRDVEIEIVYDRLWTEERLSERGRQHLDASRAAMRERLIPLNAIPTLAPTRERAGGGGG